MKSKSHPCRHPRTAVLTIRYLRGLSVYYCKKCNKRWEETEPLPEVSDVSLHKL